MIEMSQTERSFIAHLQPGHTLSYTDRDGQLHTIARNAKRHQASWLHLIHRDPPRGITSTWCGTAIQVLNNLPATDIRPISRALEELLLNPGPAALIRWEYRPRQNHSGRPFGPPVWIPAAYRLIDPEPRTLEVPK